MEWHMCCWNDASDARTPARIKATLNKKKITRIRRYYKLNPFRRTQTRRWSLKLNAIEIRFLLCVAHKVCVIPLHTIAAIVKEKKSSFALWHTLRVWRDSGGTERISLKPLYTGCLAIITHASQFSILTCGTEQTTTALCVIRDNERKKKYLFRNGSRVHAIHMCTWRYYVNMSI